MGHFLAQVIKLCVCNNSIMFEKLIFKKVFFFIDGFLQVRYNTKFQELTIWALKYTRRQTDIRTTWENIIEV